MRLPSPHPVLSVTFLCVFGLSLCISCNHSDQQTAQTPPAPPDQPLKEGKYSAAFGLSLDGALQAYYSMVNAFVNWDSSAVMYRLKTS